MNKRIVCFWALVIAVCSAYAVENDKGVDYPSGFRSWQHVKTGIIQPGHPLEELFGGIHHIYANSKAMKGLQAEQYEVGSVFVFDLRDYKNSDNVIVEAGRKRVDVMQFDMDRFADTGGWGFASFAGDSMTPAFLSNLDDVVLQADLWIHGHTHHCVDYRIGKARVVSNQRGYPSEEPGFEPTFTVELEER